LLRWIALAPLALGCSSPRVSDSGASVDAVSSVDARLDAMRDAVDTGSEADSVADRSDEPTYTCRDFEMWLYGNPPMPPVDGARCSEPGLVCEPARCDSLWWGGIDCRCDGATLRWTCMWPGFPCPPMESVETLDATVAVDASDIASEAPDDIVAAQ